MLQGVAVLGKNQHPLISPGSVRSDDRRQPVDERARLLHVVVGLVHIASLDQGDDSIEFGMGFNASLFGGFVTAGVGWNLSSVDDREYYFVGIDLLTVLQGAKDVVGN